MNNISPPKSYTHKNLLSKNIRLNLNPKFIPQDFFPQSISQFYKNKKSPQKQTFFFSTPHSPQKLPVLTNQQYSTIELKNISLLKKRLIKLKQSTTPIYSQSNTKNKPLIKKQIVARKSIRSFTMKDQKSQMKENQQNPRQVRKSRKMCDYMQKMKNVININIKFEEDVLSPTYKKRPLQWTKQNCQDLQTDDSPKLKNFRPKSEFSNRQKKYKRQSAKLQNSKLNQKPLKTKGKEVRKLIQKLQEQKDIKLKEEKDIKLKSRYDDFGDLQVNEQGMLTFYGSFNKNFQKYDSSKYQTRTSLPKLE